MGGARQHNKSTVNVYQGAAQGAVKGGETTGPGRIFNDTFTNDVFRKQRPQTGKIHSTVLRPRDIRIEVAPHHDSDDSSATGEKVTFSDLNKRGSLGPAGLHNMGLATNIIS